MWYPHIESSGFLRPSFAGCNERRKISCIKDTADFLDKLEDLGEITEGAILVNADMFGMYSIVSHIEGLEVLCKQYDKFLPKKLPIKNIIKMANFVLKSNFFEFNYKFFQQISGTAIGTRFASFPYAFIFMDFIETEFLKTQPIKPWLWKRLIDDVFFIWADSEESLPLRDLKSHVEDLKGWFLRRCYPQRIVKGPMDRAFSFPLEYDTQQNKNENGIP